MIYFLPIEQFDERYTRQWFEWFTDAFKDLRVDFKTINPEPLKANLEVGEVLDIYNTNFCKLTQFAELMKLFNQNKIKNGDIIFLLDAWGAGLESLEYVRKVSGIDFKIAGILHAGTWDPNDFTNRYNFKEKNIHALELCWISSLDEIYVATEYHKNLILKQLETMSKVSDISRNKIKVVNFPLKLKPDFKIEEKENIIIFPHRLDKEKNPEMFDHLIETFKGFDIRFVKSKEETKSKQEYYDLLKRSKVAISFADQETFGIAMLEATVHGCIPLVPNRLSYKEMYPSIFQYSGKSFSHIHNKIANFIDNYNRYAPLLPSIYSKYYTGAEEIVLNLIDLQNGEK